MIELAMPPEELELRQSLAKFFRSKLPADVANSDRLNKILDLLGPQCLVRVQYVANTLLNYYEEEEARRKQILSSLDGKFSLSVDILRSKKDNGSGFEYLNLMAHFIDDDWKMRRWVLSFTALGRHEGREKSPHEIILKTLKDWDIESKISTITMANSNSSDETLEIISRRIIGMEEMFRVYCCADIVNLLVKDAYDGISKIVEQIGTVYSFETPLLTWNNRNNQLREALILESTGKYSTREVRTWYDVPSKKGWKKVSRICDLVEDMYTIFFPLFEMGYPIASIFLNRLQELQSFLIDKCATSEGLVKDLTEKMLERLKKYMKEMNLVLAIASVLDPRLKMEYIKFSSSKFEGNLRVSTVLETISNLYQQYAVRFRVKRKREDDCGDDVVGMKLLREYNQLMQVPKSELELYLQEPVVPWSDDLSPLKWWKDASSKHPSLSRLARDIIGIPITVAISDGALEMEQRKVEDWMIYFKPEYINAFKCI